MTSCSLAASTAIHLSLPCPEFNTVFAQINKSFSNLFTFLLEKYINKNKIQRMNESTTINIMAVDIVSFRYYRIRLLASRRQRRAEVGVFRAKRHERIVSC